MHPLPVLCYVTSVKSDSLQPSGLWPPGSCVHGMLQARILEWIAMPASRRSSWPRDRTHDFYVSCLGRRVLHCFCHLLPSFSQLDTSYIIIVQCQNQGLYIGTMDAYSSVSFYEKCSTLSWKIPWTEEPGRLQSMVSWRVGHDWVTSLSIFIHVPLNFHQKLSLTPEFSVYKTSLFSKNEHTVIATGLTCILILHKPRNSNLH